MWNPTTALAFGSGWDIIWVYRYIYRENVPWPHGIPRTALHRLEKQGAVRRIARGLYEIAEPDLTEHIDLMEVCKWVPKGVVCLILALNFHGATC